MRHPLFRVSLRGGKAVERQPRIASLRMEKSDLRIVFFGTPDFAVGSLRRLVESGYAVVAVVTQPDKAVGRHASVLQAPPVKRYAASVGIPVLQPERLKDAAFLADLASFAADLHIVVAYRVLPEAVWAMPRFGTFNVHASLLPQYRGAAPINWAIIRGEKVTGVTTFFLDREIDTGRIIMQRPYAIDPDADVERVYGDLMQLGAELCTDTVDAIIATDGAVPTAVQEPCGVLHKAPKIHKETCRIAWSDGAIAVNNFVRGLSPAPGAWTEMSDGSGTTTTVKIYSAAVTAMPSTDEAGTLRSAGGRLYVDTADYRLEIKTLQAAGRKRMSARDFLNGLKGSVDGYIFR